MRIVAVLLVVAYPDVHDGEGGLTPPSPQQLVGSLPNRIDIGPEGEGVKLSYKFSMTSHNGKLSTPVIRGNSFWLHVYYKCSSGRPNLPRF
jgi:hypothetical protein